MHARSIVVAGLDGVTGEVFRRRMVPRPEVVLDWLADLPAPVAVAYEAGPTGYELQRQLAAAGYRCVIAAPSKLARPSGDRIKTDARDAMLLARLLRMDDLVAVEVPTPSRESARDLVRAREDVRGELMAARHRVSKLLLRHGHLYCGGNAWTGKHHQWLHSITFTNVGTQAAYEAACEAVDFGLARRNRLDAAIAELATDSEFTPITRRWQHKSTYRVGATLQERWNQAPEAARARAHLGNQRLHRRWRSFAARSKPHNVANVAIARELTGWCWSLATLET